MKAKLIREMDRLDHENLNANGKLTVKKVPAGTIIDHPDAFLLVRQGCAIAADDECQQKAGMTADRLKAAQYAYKRTAAGINPDDFDAYDAGLMVGYKPDGTWELGPAADPDAEQDDDEPLLAPENEEILDDE